jgi:DNA-binding transcriptional regulator YiaG
MTPPVLRRDDLMTPHALSSLSGQELATLRRGAGLTQVQLAQAAGIGRQAVSYWERKVKVGPRNWAPKRMLKVLGVSVVPHSASSTRARGGGVLLPSWLDAYVQERLAKEEARLAAKSAARQARQCVICGAMTRRGTSCRQLSVPGRRRCKFHGGMSTGPKTSEGRARIAEAQRRRWTAWRADQGP